jgi:hypothetical protein
MATRYQTRATAVATLVLLAAAWAVPNHSLAGNGESQAVADTIRGGGVRAAVVRVLRDGDLRTRLAREGRFLVENQYAWGMIATHLLQAYGAVMKSGEPVEFT